MGNFAEHIDQTINNLNFLEQVNGKIGENWDWQVTICFYTAVHLVNAHIVSKLNKNYLTHNEVDSLVNPFSLIKTACLPEDVYVSYQSLSKLSRRSRYLLSENFKKADMTDIKPVSTTYSKHFKRSIHHLNNIMDFMIKEYKVSLLKISLSCPDLKGMTFSNFKITD